MQAKKVLERLLSTTSRSSANLRRPVFAVNQRMMLSMQATSQARFSTLFNQVPKRFYSPEGGAPTDSGASDAAPNTDKAASSQPSYIKEMKD